MNATGWATQLPGVDGDGQVDDPRPARRQRCRRDLWTTRAESGGRATRIPECADRSPSPWESPPSVRPGSDTPQASRSTSSGCAASRSRSCPRRASAAGASGLGHPLHPGPAPQTRMARIPGRAPAGPGDQHRRQPLPPGRDRARSSNALEPLLHLRASSYSDQTTITRPRAEPGQVPAPRRPLPRPPPRRPRTTGTPCKPASTSSRLAGPRTTPATSSSSATAADDRASPASTTRTSSATATTPWSAAPTRTADLTIGVTHAPYLRILDAMTAAGLPLILAGHTHGGQLCIPGYGALVTNCDLDRGRVKGLHTHRESHARPSSTSRPAAAPPASLPCASPAPRRLRSWRWCRAARAPRPGGELTGLTCADAGRIGFPGLQSGSARLAQQHRGVAQLGSALRSGRRGRGFESRHPDG